VHNLLQDAAQARDQLPAAAAAGMFRVALKGSAALDLLLF
jgi:hypothetical protein